MKQERIYAQITHEVVRQWQIDTGRQAAPAWVNESPNYREAFSGLIAQVMTGALDPETLADSLGSAGRIAMPVLLAIMPGVDEEADDVFEPDRKPGYNERDLMRAAPHKREAQKPGEVVKVTA
jgi:hypothetical protein